MRNNRGYDMKMGLMKFSKMWCTHFGIKNGIGGRKNEKTKREKEIVHRYVEYMQCENTQTVTIALF